MTNRRFPVLGSDPPQTIPWAVAERAFRGWYRIEQPRSLFAEAVHLHDFERRGGFTPAELDEWAPGWREETSSR